MKTGWRILFVRAVLLLVLAGYLVQAAAAAETYQYVAKTGSEGTGDGQFGRPTGLTLDALGRIYVADEVTDRVQVFDADGAFLFALGGAGSGNGRFLSPQDVAVDATGTVYVTDGNNNRVQKFAANGSFLRAWGSLGTGTGQFRFPEGIDVAASGHVYVSDLGNDRIQVFDTNGTFIRAWGSQGSGDGQFQNPMGVAVDSAGNVYVVDDDNYRVQKFTPSGDLLTQWGSGYGSGPGQFVNPEGIAIDAAGSVYISDSGRAEIQKFTSTGEFVTKWGGRGSGDGQFSYLRDVAADPEGETVWVVDMYNYRIQKFGRVAADFSATPTAGGAALAVQFTDASSGSAITNRSWDFGDGDPASSDLNPSHTYSAAGNYTVTLTVATALATVTETKTGYITVSAPPAPVANFTANATSGIAPLAVAFTDTSTGDGIANWSWSFGDGAVSSEQNPVHVYAVPGTYDVNLAVTNTGGSDTEMKTGYITATEPPITGADRAYFLVSTVPAGAEIFLEDLSGTRRLQGTTSAGPLNVTICLTCTPVRKIVASLPGYLEASYAIAAYPARGETVPVTLTLQRGTVGPFPAPHIPATVIQAEDFDTGGEGIAYHDAEPRNLGGAYRTAEGVDVETQGGVTDVGWIRAGEWLTYTVDTTIVGNFRLTLRTANPDPGRKSVQVLVDGTPVTEVDVGSTGGWTTYAEYGGIEPLHLGAGRHTVTLAFEGVDRINLDWLLLAAGTVPAGGGQPYPSAHLVPGRVEAEDYDTGGFADTTPTNEGGAYRNDPVDIEAGGSNYDVGWIRAGEYLQYSVDTAAAGTYAISFRVANPGSAMPVAVRVNGGAWLLTIPTTGSFGTWQTATLSGVPLAAGRNTVRVETGRASSFNLDYLEFSAGAPTTTVTTTPTPSPGAATFTAAPLSAPKGSAVKFTLTPTAGKTIRSAWWSFDAPAHLNTWNSRATNPTFYYPAAGTFSPLVKIAYTDGSTETVQRTGYIRVT